MRSIGLGILVALSCTAATPPSTALAVGIPAGGGPRQGTQLLPVEGTGIHRFTSAVIHSSEPTPTGLVQRSTETVDLDGDLRGRILYQPLSVFDFVAGTLVNTGHQVFSGTVLGTGPVMLHDDAFRFEVDLTTGATMGEVHLVDRIAGPRVRCHLEVVGTGLTPEGDATFDYRGECHMKPGDALAATLLPRTP